MQTPRLCGPRCPLCGYSPATLFLQQKAGIPWHLYSASAPHAEGLRFFRCSSCDLIIKDPAIRPSPEQAKRHYEKHNNDVSNPGYRAHLLRLLTPIASRLPSEAVGLDYGCGPTLTLEPLARELGLECHSFDPVFFPDATLLRGSHYDFLLCSEVAEHFEEPEMELRRVLGFLRAGGILGIMTQHPPQSFADWWYQRDPTHLVFYSQRTFTAIASLFGLELLFSEQGVGLFRKPV